MNEVNKDPGINDNEYLITVKTDPWSYKNLGDLLEFKNGLNYRAGDVGEEVLIVGVSDFKNAFLVDETKLSTVTVESLSEDYLMNEGDFVFVRSNGNKDLIGRVLFAKKISKRITHSGFTIRARNKSDLLLSEYCAIFCSSSLVKRQFMTKGGGSNISNLNQQLLSEIEIPLPSIIEQKKITSILSTWDKAIELKEKLIEQKKEQKKGLMQKLLMGEVRLPGFDGEWEDSSLGRVIDFYNGYAFKSATYEEVGQYKIITIANVQDGELDLSKTSKITTLPTDIREHQILELGDILLSMTGNVGRVCIVNEENCLLNQRVGKVSPIEIDKYFLYFTLSSNRFLNEMINKAQGGAQGNLSIKDIKSFNIQLPSIDEQKGIGKILLQFEKTLLSMNKELALLKKQKQGLMQNLLTGKVRVKVQ